MYVFGFACLLSLSSVDTDCFELHPTNCKWFYQRKRKYLIRSSGWTAIVVVKNIQKLMVKIKTKAV